MRESQLGVTASPEGLQGTLGETLLAKSGCRRKRGCSVFPLSLRLRLVEMFVGGRVSSRFPTGNLFKHPREKKRTGHFNFIDEIDGGLGRQRGAGHGWSDMMNVSKRLNHLFRLKWIWI